MPRKPTFRPFCEMLEDRRVPATLTVKNLDDAGIGSLRQAILDANAQPNADTIVFKAGLEGTIHLAGEIAITTNVTLTGPGAKKIALSGGFTSRIFNIDDSTATLLNITIKGLELRHGVAAGDGGAINSAENLTLVSTVFTRNRSTSNGGAINCDGNLTVNKSTITGNTSTFGGGIQCGTATISGSTVSGNTAAIGGGGISCTIAMISGSTVSGNTSAILGGGIACDTATISGSTVSGNTAASYGGGMNCNGATISGSTFAGNTAGSFGGGLACFTNATISGSTISGNTAGTTGGGLQINGTGGSPISTIRNTTISGNRAGSNGGGIRSTDPDLTVSNSTIAFNRADGAGGGMYLDGVVNVLASCLVADNDSAGADKDIETAGAGSFALDHCLIGVRDDAVFLNLGSNQIGTVPAPIDPLLAPLANNGGPTQTHALKKGSPALNAGSNPAGLTKDQRGGKFKRKFGSAVDIGAFERQ